MIKTVCRVSMMLLLWFRLRYDCVHVRQWLTRPKCMSFPLFCWQFSCCGSTGPQSWITLNPEAIEGEGNRPPSCALCALTDTNCQQYTYVSNTTGLTVNFNALNVVRWLELAVSKHDTSYISSFSLPQGCLNILTVAAYTIGGLGIAFGILEVCTSLWPSLTPVCGCFQFLHIAKTGVRRGLGYLPTYLCTSL